jgi:drug/metabolite transporter (DMT)-like permease
MKIKNTLYLTVLLIVISAIFYSLPIVLLNQSNHKTILITSFSALIVIFLYGMYKSKDEVFNIEPYLLLKMMIVGICYGIGLILYIESVKYNHIDIINLHTIIIFVLSFIISYLFLNMEVNKWKVLGVVVIVIGILLVSKK